MLVASLFAWADGVVGMRMRELPIFYIFSPSSRAFRSAPLLHIWLGVVWF